VRDIHHSLASGPNFSVFYLLNLYYHLLLLFQQQKYDMRVETNYCFFDGKGNFMIEGLQHIVDENHLHNHHTKVNQ
jgi:hypothetical protein